jgi:hypothetical protein
VRKEGADLAECKAQQAMEAHCERWGDLLPGDQQSLLAWVLKADDTQVMDLLAVCTASTLNTVQGREAPQPVADAIAAAVDLDMSELVVGQQRELFCAVSRYAHQGTEYGCCLSGSPVGKLNITGVELNRWCGGLRIAARVNSSPGVRDEHCICTRGGEDFSSS